MESVNRTKPAAVNIKKQAVKIHSNSVLDANDNGLICFDFKGNSAINPTERFYEAGKIKLFAGGPATS